MGSGTWFHQSEAVGKTSEDIFGFEQSQQPLALSQAVLSDLQTVGVCTVPSVACRQEINSYHLLNTYGNQ